MTSFMSNYAKAKIMAGDIDLNADDIRVILVDSSFNGAANHQFVGDIPVLGELNGTGYVRKALSDEAVNVDTVNNRAEFDATDVTWTGINAGTAAGAVLYKHVTNDADSPFIAFIDSGGFPITTNGGDVTIQWNAEGIIQGA